MSPVNSWDELLDWALLLNVYPVKNRGYKYVWLRYIWSHLLSSPLWDREACSRADCRSLHWRNKMKNVFVTRRRARQRPDNSPGLCTPAWPCPRRRPPSWCGFASVYEFATTYSDGHLALKTYSNIYIGPSHPTSKRLKSLSDNLFRRAPRSQNLSIQVFISVTHIPLPKRLKSLSQ